MKIFFNISLVLMTVFLYHCGSGFDDGGSGDEGSVPWAGTIQLGTAVDEFTEGIATDSKNNVYIAGHTGGDFDGHTNAGGSDVFLLKYNASGQKKWSRTLGSSASETVFAVTTDGEDNIYITGYTSGDLAGGGNLGSNDIYLAKYDSSGTKQWVRQFGSDGDEWSRGIAADSNNNIYVTGWTKGDMGGNGNPGSNDIFLVKYNSSGTEQWVRQLGASGDDTGRGLVVDSDNNVYITGWTAGDLDGEVTTGGLDVFLSMYSSSGVYNWTRLSGSTANDLGLELAIDSAGNIYITGETHGDWNGTTSGGTDMFLLKYNTSRTVEWVSQLGSEGNDYGDEVAVDSTGNIYVCGVTINGFNGDTDAFLVKYLSTGETRSYRQFGSTSIDVSEGLAIDSDNNIYVTGWTEGIMDSNSNAGGIDIFFTRFMESPVEL
ncbi:MAG: hypothetical protein GY754_42900 [bacterium]|nr:hypothetical protein [bacterium]